MNVICLFTLAVYFVLAATRSPVCEPGWFGSSCQYNCHCESECQVCDGNRLCQSCDGDGECTSVDRIPDCPKDNCDTDGQCINGTACRRGWFGPSCQYVELIQNANETVRINSGANVTNVLSDGDDTTCLSDSTLQFVNVTWSEGYPFTWLRLHVNREDLLHNITVQFRNSTSTSATVDCTNRRDAAISDTTLDIHCDLSVTISQVILTGEGIKALCSLYISGGRNVALRQNSTQTSTKDNQTADKAVEGDRYGIYFKGNYPACTHTEPNQNPASWSLTLSRQHYINRYVIYNRRDCCEDRLQGFTLTSYNITNTTVFNKTDMTNNQKQLVYSFTSVVEKRPVSAIRVDKRSGSMALTLCEVELYGDSACEDGKFGRECEKDCNCNDETETCLVTGSCLSGCAAGFYGDACGKECPSTQHGVSCKENCSVNCFDQLCHGRNGSCLSCVRGKSGDTCEEDCPQGTYGQDCNKNCSEYCGNDQSCDPVNGSCIYGCQKGFLPPLCQMECPDRSYGQNCSMNCSVKCKVNETAAPAVCRHVTGICLLGCVNGTTGDECQTGKQENDDDDGDDDDDEFAAWIIGVIVAAIVVLLIIGIILGVALWRRKRPPTKSVDYPTVKPDNETPEPVLSPPNAYIYNARAEDLVANREESGLIKANDESKPGGYYNALAAMPSTTAIHIGELNAYLSSHDPAYFRQQFERVSGVNTEFTTDVGLSDENKHKNRYKNICAYDHSRVHLKINPRKHEGDYINASYVEGYNREEKYIASQGPNQIILDDFVRMLWEHKPDKVVMLTNLIEDGKTRCEKYWPDDDTMVYGPITVELLTTHVFADYTIRKLRLKKEKKTPHDLTQFHFTSWPDKGVPDNPWPLVDFEQRVAFYPTSKPIVVHCSAGVGRTGTFIALRHVMREAEDKGTMDFYSTLVKMRTARMHMIQTLEQYLFLHRAAHVAMVCLGTTLTASMSTERLDKLQTVSRAGKTNMEQEYTAVCNACADKRKGGLDQIAGNDAENIYQNSRTAENKLKNRVSNILPDERYRPVLSCDLKSRGDYINAVLVPSFTRRDSQILTQLPMPGTTIDFWRLVKQYRVSLIVGFEMDAEDKDQTIADILPASENDVVTSGPFDIKTGPIQSSSFWDKQDLTVSTNSQYSSMSLIDTSEHFEFHVKHLKCTGISTETKNLLAIVEHVRSLRSSGEERTLYMCRNGATYSGLICVLTLLLDRLDNDHCLTVPLVVGAIKYIRPQVIPTLDQYKSLYDVLHWYNENSSVYSNVGDVGQDAEQRSLGDTEIRSDKSVEESDDGVKVYDNTNQS